MCGRVASGAKLTVPDEQQFRDMTRWLYTGFSALGYLIAAAVALAAVLYRNRHQYAFFARRCGLGFALAVVPLDLVNYAVNGVALVVGWVLREVVGEPKPDPTVQAFAEVGIKTWPPVPIRSIDRAAERTVERTVAGPPSV